MARLSTDSWMEIADDWDPQEQAKRKRNQELDAQIVARETEEIISRIDWVDTSTWDSEPCPEREWAIKDRIPLRQVTLFSGEGAIGKSIVELMCSVAHVIGGEWLGSLPEPGGAFYIGCEDDDKELRIRLAPIVRHYKTTFDELRAKGFRFKSLAGQDAVLAAPDRSGVIKPTPLFDLLYEEAGDLKPKHIGIDTTADTFGGNENDRTQVRQYVGLMRKLAIVSKGSVNLLSHPSLTGINTGSGLSGSTAWHNSVRSRMYMTAPKLEAGEQPDTDLRELQFKKSNYGPISNSIALRYKNGLFLPEHGLSNIDKAAREAKVEEILISIGKKIIERGEELSPHQTSHSYAPSLVAKDPGLQESRVRAGVSAPHRSQNRPCRNPKARNVAGKENRFVSGVKGGRAPMSAFDPKRTCAPHFVGSKILM